MTPKQQRFVEEYLVDLNATQAALRAGYSKRAAAKIGFENLQKPEVAGAIAEAQAKRAEKTGWNAQRVLDELCEMAQMDVADVFDGKGNLKPIPEWPLVWRQSINGLESQEIVVGGDPIGVLKKIKWRDRAKILELIGKHVNIGAFSEKSSGTEDLAAALREVAGVLPD